VCAGQAWLADPWEGALFVQPRAGRVGEPLRRERREPECRGRGAADAAQPPARHHARDREPAPEEPHAAQGRGIKEDSQGGATSAPKAPPHLAFTRYSFTSKLYCGSLSSCYCSPDLQSLPYCNTIARPLRNIRPPTDPFFLCHTPYNIGDGNIA